MATDDEILGRGIAFPAAIDARGRLASRAGAEKVRESVLLILGTEPGERLMRPDFGCPLKSLVFAPNSPTTSRLAQFRIRDAIARWEPRVEVDSVRAEHQLDGRYGPFLSFQVVYRVKSTGVRDGITFELPLG